MYQKLRTIVGVIVAKFVIYGTLCVEQHANPPRAVATRSCCCCRGCGLARPSLYPVGRRRRRAKTRGRGSPFPFIDVDRACVRGWWRLRTCVACKTRTAKNRSVHQSCAFVRSTSFSSLHARKCASCERERARDESARRTTMIPRSVVVVG